MDNKLKAWEKEDIDKTCEIVIQLKKHIEDIISSGNMPISPKTMPHSIIPTETLYSILTCYELMYNNIAGTKSISTSREKMQH